MALGNVNNPALKRTLVFYERIERKLTLDQLAKRSGVGPTQLHKYEVGLALPRVDNAIALAKVFDTSVEELFRGAI